MIPASSIATLSGALSTDMVGSNDPETAANSRSTEGKAHGGHHMRRGMIPRPSGTVEVVVVATLLTLLNALKPIHIDDVIWSYFAQHIAKHPTAPFDFTILWNQVPQSAQNVMAPPFLPYWWAAAIRLFGDQPFLWKASLYPINLTLAFSIRALAQRLAPGLERQLLWLVVLSPTILPGENMMLDVPCEALVLASLAIFLHACDRRSWRRAVVAVVLLGLATLTKWTAFTGIGVLIVATLLFAPSRSWLVFLAIPVGMFVSWEAFIHFTIGESHFLHHLRIESSVHSSKDLIVPLVMILGGVVPAASLLGALGLKWSRRVVLAMIAMYVAGFLIVAADPLWHGGTLTNVFTGKPWAIRSDTPVFLLFGVVSCCTIVAAVIHEVRDCTRKNSMWDPQNRILAFLLAWLLIELVGYFVLSPFPAVRRVIGLAVAMTFMAGYMAAEVREVPTKTPSTAWIITAFSVALGLLFFAVDTLEAFTSRHAAEYACAWIRARDTSRPIWFTGTHGFEFYATRFGMRPMCPNYTRLNAGDWLVIHTPDAEPVQGEIGYSLDDSKVQLQLTMAFEDRVPLSTVLCYYLGRRPIEHQVGPRSSVAIYRVNADYSPVGRRLPRGRRRRRGHGSTSSDPNGQVTPRRRFCWSSVGSSISGATVASLTHEENRCGSRVRFLVLAILRQAARSYPALRSKRERWRSASKSTRPSARIVTRPRALSRDSTKVFFSSRRATSQ